jgi:hypothetical protein
MIVWGLFYLFCCSKCTCAYEIIHPGNLKPPPQQSSLPYYNLTMEIHSNTANMTRSQERRRRRQQKQSQRQDQEASYYNDDIVITESVTISASHNNRFPSNNNDGSDWGMLHPDLSSITVVDHDGGDKTSTTYSVYVKVQATTHTYENGSQRISWEGILVNDNNQQQETTTTTSSTRIGFATFVQMPNGQLGGMWTNEMYSHSIIPLPNGTVLVETIAWEDIPESIMGRVIEEDEEEDESNKDSSSNKGYFAVDAFESFHSNQITVSKGSAFGAIQGPNYHRRRRRLQTSLENTIIDLLMIVSNRAMCSAAKLSFGCPYNEDNAAPIKTRVATAEAQTNSAMQMVGLAVEIRFVQIIFLDAISDDLYVNGTTLKLLQNSPTMKQWREDYGADLVAAIGNFDPVKAFCGMAYMFRPFTVSAWNPSCFNSFAVTHEM